MTRWRLRHCDGKTAICCAPVETLEVHIPRLILPISRFQFSCFAVNLFFKPEAERAAQLVGQRRLAEQAECCRAVEGAPGHQHAPCRSRVIVGVTEKEGVAQHRFVLAAARDFGATAAALSRRRRRHTPAKGTSARTQVSSVARATPAAACGAGWFRVCDAPRASAAGQKKQPSFVAGTAEPDLTADARHGRR